MPALPAAARLTPLGVHASPVAGPIAGNRIGARNRKGKRGHMLAISGLLEWVYLAMLVVMVAVAGVFGVFVLLQMFRNPSR